MALVFISESPLEENYLEFENDAIAGQDQGVLQWDDPYQVGSIWKVDYSGKNVTGGTIANGTVDIDYSQSINPTKVAWWLLGVLQDVICKNCDTP